MSSRAADLTVRAASIDFQNPLLLAAGTAAYGREISSVVDLDSLGGIITKAVSREPRKGAPSPRVAEFDGGMINAIGLANPGVDEVRTTELPWLAANLSRARVIVNVVGKTAEDFGAVVGELSDSEKADAFELNVSCPNLRAGGMEFGADSATLMSLVNNARSSTNKPIFVKLSPTLPDIVNTARVAIGAGADGISLVNTMPGLVIDVESRRPVLGFGTGGVSGPGLLPIGVRLVHLVSRAVKAPISLIGVGGVTRGTDVIQYLMAGATLVAVGTAAMRDPSAPARIIEEMSEWMFRHGIKSPTELIGQLEWQS